MLKSGKIGAGIIKNITFAASKILFNNKSYYETSN